MIEHIPRNIESLVLESSRLPTTIDFEHLRELRLRRVRTNNENDEVPWIRCHSGRGTMRKLYLGAAIPRGLRVLPHACNELERWLTSIISSASQVTQLGLESVNFRHMNLSALSVSDMPSLEELTLRRCVHVTNLLQAFLQNNKFRTLRTLALTVASAQPDIAAFLQCLGRETRLKEMTILTGGSETPLPLDSISAHLPSVRPLVLEARRCVKDPETVPATALRLSEDCRKLLGT
ncbi:MAG: hypothetical protein M1816_000369 [Peltula sp. TS41687]|nr:MAG: hypothetical protein M1816_000369 [Peltula sp. TS41687]